MKRRLTFPALLLTAAAAMAQTTVSPSARVLLIGDSTMATRNGYGDALCARLRPGVECLNLAKNGRSSGSFRAEGLWEAAMAHLQTPVPTWVLIQFGHNDQPGKPGRSTDLQTEYPVNLARYVADVRQLGATPVLVTPLTRRTFKGDQLQNDLLPWAESMKTVAKQSGVALIDLNTLSFQAVQVMGQAQADTLATEPPPAEPVQSASTATTEVVTTKKSTFDRTHVGIKGAQLFSGMVIDAARAVPGLVGLVALVRAD
ncbi:MAG: rhamnogalacturonan acetylesterase [Rhodoferax sp.]|nr:rhamnogalacturonan acetylesterase [Rhodoferax sp.]